MSTTYIFGHGPVHDAEMPDLLNDAVGLERSRPRLGPITRFGDWDIDAPPAFASAPWTPRHSHHGELRGLSQSLTDSLQLEIRLPEFVSHVPEGPFVEDALQVPITRIPPSKNAKREVPNMLDCAVASKNATQSVNTTWKYAPADLVDRGHQQHRRGL